MDEDQINDLPSEDEAEEAQTLMDASKMAEATISSGDSGRTVQMAESPQPVKASEPPIIKKEPAAVPQENKTAKWLQFPRRLFFLLIAGGGAVGIIFGLQRLANYRLTRTDMDRNTEILWEMAPNTILLLFCVLLVATLLGAVAAAIGVLVHFLEVRAGLPASVFKGMGRLLVFSSAGLPVVSAGLVLLFIFFMRLKLLPGGGLYNPGPDRNLGDILVHLILPVLTLSVYPAILAAQAATREVTLSRPTGAPRGLLAGIFKGLAVLLQQTGGLLSAILVAEVIISLPGLGGMMYRSFINFNPDFLFRGMLVLIAVTVLGRILAELLGWIGRLVNVPAQVPQSAFTRSRKTARVVWVILCLLLLAIPIFLAIRAGGIPEHIAIDTNLSEKYQLPSELHPWGTDMMGRDGMARAYRGLRETLWMAMVAAGIVLLPALIFGALYAFLHSRKRWWSESLADLLFIPVDILLLLPALPLYLVLVLLAKVKDIETSWQLITVIIAILVLPRALRVFQALWVPVVRFRPAFILVLPALGSMIFSFIYASFVLLLSVDWLGIGVLPPTPTIGALMRDAFQGIMAHNNLTLFLGSILFVFLSLFPLFLSADALAGFFTSKEGMAHLNE